MLDVTDRFSGTGGNGFLISGHLNFNAIYIGPLFESTSHGYDTRDYRKVDSRLGTNENFRTLSPSAIGTDIQVVVDGVFNHTGREFFAFLDIAANRESSPYRDWYRV